MLLRQYIFEPLEFNIYEERQVCPSYLPFLSYAPLKKLLAGYLETYLTLKLETCLADKG